ncbi:MAG: hypothetical protein COA50_11145 [Flavobacteriaceae bacterium]|nr:MAG: hypothetical protein COA50_11145 [Flavobacteriaceae bacterium]
MKNLKNQSIFGYASLLFLSILLIGCKAKGHTPSTPSIDCEVVSGPNKGKKGKRTEDGWCEGDWGGTECTPRSKCKDISAEGPDTSIGQDFEGGELLIEAGGNAIVGIVPPHGSSANEYCQIDDSKLSVIFRNTGDRPSSDRTTNVTVEFITGSTNTTETKLMPSIPSGGTIEMIFEVPNQCFGPDCDFSIKWSNQAVVFGRCIG